MAQTRYETGRSNAERWVANLLIVGLLIAVVLCLRVLWASNGYASWATDASNTLLSRFGSALFWDRAHNRWTEERPEEEHTESYGAPPPPPESATLFLFGNRVSTYEELLSLASLWLGYAFVSWATLDSARRKWAWLGLGAVPVTVFDALHWHSSYPQHEVSLFSLVVGVSALCGVAVSHGALRGLTRLSGIPG